MGDDEADGNVGRHAGESEQAGHEADLPVRQSGRRADLGQERGKGAHRERAAEPIHRQERDEGRTAHGSHDLTGKLPGWAADPTSICDPAPRTAESD